MNNIVNNDENADTKIQADCESLYAYISENIMHYPTTTAFPDSMKKSVDSTIKQMQLYRPNFCHANLLYLLRKYQCDVDYCLNQKTFNNEMHRLNTALKVIKNKVVKFYLTNKQCESEIADKNGINIPQFEGDTEELRGRLKQKCGNDDDNYNLVIASLVDAYLEGKIRIIGV